MSHVAKTGGEVLIVVAGLSTIVAGLIAFVAVVPVLYAWAVIKLWGWFLTPYAAVPPIAAVYGAILILTLLRRHVDEPKRNSKEAWGSLAVIVLRPLLAVGFAWLVKGWL